MTRIQAWLLIIVVWLFSVLLMLPFQEQSYSDDFAYAQSVRHFLESGQLKVSERVAPSAITHILWGSLFAKLSGFSFGSLHVSQVVLLPIFLITNFEIISTFEKSKRKSLIIIFYLFSIPWIISMAYTYLTTITFLTAQCLALLF